MGLIPSANSQFSRSGFALSESENEMSDPDLVS